MFFTMWAPWLSKDAEYYVDFKNINQNVAKKVIHEITNFFFTH
jgi:hypothetical protein